MSEIAYQNKDITSKVFAEKFKGKSFKIYGLDIPKIKQVLPTNIPQIKANELRIDNAFLLNDDTVAIIDYESTYKSENKHKYINYINHIADCYSKEWNKSFRIRMIVIYTADVEKNNTEDILDVGCLKLEIESAYLSEINKEEISLRLKSKVNKGIQLSEEELMEFIILPLAYKGNDSKNNAIKEAIDMAKKIQEDDIKIFLLSGIAVFADKVIKAEYAAEIRRLLGMTKVGQLFENEIKLSYEKGREKEVFGSVQDGDYSIERGAEKLNLSIEEFEEKMLKAGYRIPEIA